VAERPPAARWSQAVAERSNALDLEPGVFTWGDPQRIAASLKRSAERSRCRKTDPFRSAMSMLDFCINAAGRRLPLDRRANRRSVGSGGDGPQRFGDATFRPAPG
jgi:hypothetical protein